MRSTGRSVLARVRHWLGRPAIEQRRKLRNKLLAPFTWPFALGAAALPNVFLAYQPDSQVHFNEHPEFAGLFRRFTGHNRLNSAGDIPRLWDGGRQAIDEFCRTHREYLVLMPDKSGSAFIRKSR